MIKTGRKFLVKDTVNDVPLWSCPEEIKISVLKGEFDKAVEHSKKNFSYDDTKFWGGSYNVYESAELADHPLMLTTEKAPAHKEKVLVINPNQKLRASLHEHKSEYWFAVTDNISYLAGNSPDELEYCQMKAGDVCFIKPGTVHRIMNETNEVGLIYEVQAGFCHEMDVKRFPEVDAQY